MPEAAISFRRGRRKAASVLLWEYLRFLSG
jgi:hypothetical protein